MDSQHTGIINEWDSDISKFIGGRSAGGSSSPSRYDGVTGKFLSLLGHGDGTNKLVKLKRLRQNQNADITVKGSGNICM